MVRLSLRHETGGIPLPAPFVLLGPRQTGRCPPTLGRGTCFPESTDSNTHLFRKHPHTQPECYLSNPAPGGQSR